MDNNKLITDDHDILVSLVVKMDSLTQKVDDLSNSLIERMIKVEGRLDAMDVYHAGIKLSDYDDMVNWTKQFRANYKLILFFGGIILGSIGGIAVAIIRNILKF